MAIHNGTYTTQVVALSHISLRAIPYLQTLEYLHSALEDCEELLQCRRYQYSSGDCKVAHLGLSNYQMTDDAHCRSPSSYVADSGASLHD
jgi:hypothetical protein